MSDEIKQEKMLHKSIAVEQKPWFFMYRYSAEKAKFTTYDKSARFNCKIRFGKTLDTLIESENRTDEEEVFLINYEKYMPVSRAPGTMNRICWKIEDAFKSTNVLPNVNFDFSILKNDSKYSQEDFDAIKELYDEYNKNVQLVLKRQKKNEEADSNTGLLMDHIKQVFTEECEQVCPNSYVLSNILVDLCYTSNKNKAFAWDVAGEQIYQNVLTNSGNKLSIPIKDENGNTRNYKVLDKSDYFV